MLVQCESIASCYYEGDGQRMITVSRALAIAVCRCCWFQWIYCVHCTSSIQKNLLMAMFWYSQESAEGRTSNTVVSLFLYFPPLQVGLGLTDESLAQDQSILVMPYIQKGFGAPNLHFWPNSKIWNYCCYVPVLLVWCPVLMMWFNFWFIWFIRNILDL